MENENFRTCFKDIEVNKSTKRNVASNSNNWQDCKAYSVFFLLFFLYRISGKTVSLTFLYSNASKYVP